MNSRLLARIKLYVYTNVSCFEMAYFSYPNGYVALLNKNNT